MGMASSRRGRPSLASAWYADEVSGLVTSPHRRTTVRLLSVAAALFMTVASVAGQSGRPLTVTAFGPSAQVGGRLGPAAAPGPSKWRAFVVVDSNAMAASQTFDAIFGTSRLSAKGFGGEALSLWRGLFARAAMSSMRQNGSRVIVSDGEVASLGIPLRMSMRPVEIGAGWRMAPVARGLVVPYAGGGMLRVTYTESSDFAEAAEDSETAFSGAHVFGGLEARVAPWVVAGAELQYRSLADALGDGGVSKEFGESNLGGLTFRVLIGIRR
jgi:hypothetical protein